MAFVDVVVTFYVTIGACYCYCYPNWNGQTGQGIRDRFQIKPQNIQVQILKKKTNRNTDIIETNDLAWLRYRSSTDSSSDQGSHFHLSLLFLFAALLRTDEDEDDIYNEDNYDDDYDDHDDINDDDNDTGSKTKRNALANFATFPIGP